MSLTSCSSDFCRLLIAFAIKSGPTKCGPDLDPNFLTLIVFLKESFEEKKLIFKKVNRRQQKHEKSSMQSMGYFWQVRYLLQYQMPMLHGPHREKTCLWGLRPDETETSLLSYRD